MTDSTLPNLDKVEVRVRFTEVAYNLHIPLLFLFFIFCTFFLSFFCVGWLVLRFIWVGKFNVWVGLGGKGIDWGGSFGERGLASGIWMLGDDFFFRCFLLLQKFNLHGSPADFTTVYGDYYCCCVAMTFRRF